MSIEVDCTTKERGYEEAMWPTAMATEPQVGQLVDPRHCRLRPLIIKTIIHTTVYRSRTSSSGYLYAVEYPGFRVVLVRPPKRAKAKP